MELYACGNNAWWQLDDLLGPALQTSWTMIKPRYEPQDWTRFRKVQVDESVEVLHVGESDVLIKTSRGLFLTGGESAFTRIFLDDPSLVGKIAQTSSGQVADTTGNEYHSLANYLAKDDLITGYSTTEHSISEYSATDYATANYSTTLYEATHHTSKPALQYSSDIFPYPAIQIAAGSTHFASLHKTGSSNEVRTWGDARHHETLGRSIVSATEPTWTTDVTKWCRTPGAVTDLLNLPNPALIKEIAAGGYATAALTGDGDCYVWGSSRDLAFLTAEPTPLNFDVQSVAIGEEHMIVLTKEGEVRVCGKNRNGQLGLGDGITEVKEWTAVDLKSILEKGRKVVGVKAGGNCSILTVKVGEEMEN